MSWQIDDSKPIHSQIVEELINRIMSGKYRLGSKMPSVRDLAVEAKVNPNTMQKALMELEGKGFVLSKSTSGNYVTEDKNLIKAAKQNLSDTVAARFIRDMRSLDLDEEEIVSKILKELRK